MRRIEWIVAAAVALVPSAVLAADVTVIVEGVRSGGTLAVSLQTREQFLSEAHVHEKVVSDHGAGTVSVTFQDVQPGDYSVNVWHDDNGNGQFDWASGGSPLDGWALVNGAGLTGMPTFDQVKTTVGAEGAEVRLPMIYARAEASPAE